MHAHDHIEVLIREVVEQSTSPWTTLPSEIDHKTFSFRLGVLYCISQRIAGAKLVQIKMDLGHDEIMNFKKLRRTAIEHEGKFFTMEGQQTLPEIHAHILQNANTKKETQGQWRAVWTGMGDMDLDALLQSIPHTDEIGVWVDHINATIVQANFLQQNTAKESVLPPRADRRL